MKFQIENLKPGTRNTKLTLAARVVELADTPDLGSGSARIGGSSPLARTTKFNEFNGFNVSDTRNG